ncbi:hypothetical protein BN1013_01714 [Candidatus Rubidus massiliensis]|nr:hypothetical protein BN1013_01714 [Candidatus Rubidus massiliensis]
MFKQFIASLALFVAFQASFASELMQRPWNTRYAEFYPQIPYRLQTFKKIESNHQNYRYNSHDSFVSPSIALSVEPFSLEFETELAKTRKRNFGLDHVSLTGRYQLTNDIIGDFLSIIGGIKWIRAISKAVKDPASFHHGKTEFEFFLTFGKELTKYNDWNNRWWVFTALGVADRGYPWLRGNLGWQFKHCQDHVFELYVKTLWGFGPKNFHLPHFKGYGHINHQSIDIGAAFEKRFDNEGTLRLEYRQRVFAKNFPKDTHQWIISYLYPFGL